MAHRHVVVQYAVGRAAGCFGGAEVVGKGAVEDGGFDHTGTGVGTIVFKADVETDGPGIGAGR